MIEGGLNDRQVFFKERNITYFPPNSKNPDRVVKMPVCRFHYVEAPAEIVIVQLSVGNPSAQEEFAAH